jgi:hypothetical protein
VDINERKLRQEKIRLLQIKSKRNQIINEMKSKNIDITLDSFLEIDYSQELISNLFNNKIYNLSEEEKEEFKFEHSKDKAVSFLSKLKSRIPNEIQDKKIIIFHLNYLDTGAIILRLEDILRILIG